MSSTQPVVICPPDEGGGRRVRIDGTTLGRAWSVKDVAAILQEAGLRSFDEVHVAYSALIEWRGGGPSQWTCDGPRPAPGFEV
ncbi:MULTISPECIES: hypothetical protein [unclassified Streptomyces]|uniref:hypothetical protein n=1 Tax=unclassified Streptomyces TaxID=2593676 RepID=UPI002E19BD65|nr:MULTISPECIES: hypothetical protein [unclassified Streptomyces]